MPIFQITSALLSHSYLVFLAIALVVGILKSRQIAEPAAKLDRFLAEIVFYAIGLAGVWAFVFHAFFQAMSAASIGWTPSPFEWELAWATLGLSVIAILQLWVGRPYRIAACIMASIFLWGAAIQHINQILCCKNYAPNNAGLFLYWDIVLPLVLIALAVASRRRFARP